ncbi:MAG: M23 family metallopeptidase [Rikenellaceae bacterium]
MAEKEHTSPPQPRNNDDSSVAFRQQAYGIIRRLLVGFVLVSLANGAFAYIFYTPKAYQIDAENQRLSNNFELLQKRIEAAEQQLAEIAYRDANIYRPLFGLESNYQLLCYEDNLFEANQLTRYDYSNLIKQSNEKIDIFARNLYSQSLSLDRIQTLVNDRELLINAIPGIWPIDRTLLKYGGRPYGQRYHPIYKRYMMHHGVDLAGTTGDPIYATADGVVIKSEQGYRTVGYGQMILIDHGFGYETRYGHLSKRLVERGDSIRRGDVIGLMGSTGGSTGPHLHYEVIIRDKTVDPVNFFNRNMSKDEYQQIKDLMVTSSSSSMGIYEY